MGTRAGRSHIGCIFPIFQRRCNGSEFANLSCDSNIVIEGVFLGELLLFRSHRASTL